MRRHRRLFLGVIFTLPLLLVAGGLALQPVSGGIRPQTLSAAVLGVLLGAAGAIVWAKRPDLWIG
ncbi:MAG: hypothetical protein ACRDLK_11790, partial [Gaiellaceae bacterium]